MGNIHEDNRQNLLSRLPSHVSLDALRLENEAHREEAAWKRAQKKASSKENESERENRVVAESFENLGVLNILREVRELWGVGEIYAKHKRQKEVFINDGAEYGGHDETRTTYKTTRNLSNGYVALALVALYPGVEERQYGRGKKHKESSGGTTYNSVDLSTMRSSSTTYGSTLVDVYEYYETVIVQGYRFSVLKIDNKGYSTPFIHYSNGGDFLAIPELDLDTGYQPQWQTSEPIRSRDQLRQAVADYCAMQQAEGLMPQQIAQREREHGARAPRIPRKGFLGKLFP